MGMDDTPGQQENQKAHTGGRLVSGNGKPVLNDQINPPIFGTWGRDSQVLETRDKLLQRPSHLLEALAIGPKDVVEQRRYHLPIRPNNGWLTDVRMPLRFHVNPVGRQLIKCDGTKWNRLRVDKRSDVVVRRDPCAGWR